MAVIELAQPAERCGRRRGNKPIEFWLRPAAAGSHLGLRHPTPADKIPPGRSSRTQQETLRTLMSTGSSTLVESSDVHETFGARARTWVCAGVPGIRRLGKESRRWHT